jgi:hypothetical protein
MTRWLIGLGTCAAAGVAFWALGCAPPVHEDQEAKAWKSGDKSSKKDKPKGSSSGSGMQAVEAKSYDGVLKGKVVGVGDRSKLKDMDMAFMDSLTGKQDADHCKMGNKTQYEYRVGANGNVGNVIVWIEPEPKFYFKVPEGQVKAVAKKVEMGQPGCRFTPHCVTLFPSFRDQGALKKSGQEFIVKNDDTKAHNTKLQGGPRNPGGDVTLPVGGTKPFTLQPDKAVVNVSCGIHPYMRGYVRVFDHPWATVSNPGKSDADPELGTFEIKGVPVGVPVRLFAWHEKGEFLNQGGGQGQPITLKPGDNVSEFKLEFPK